MSENTSTSSRTGTITIAGQTLNITQSGTTSLCTYTILPTSQSFASTNSTGNVTVTALANSCAWTAISSLSWATITSGSSGTGSGTVTLSVAANTTGATRAGNITIAGQTFTVTQLAVSADSSIRVQGVTLTEDLLFNQNKSITLTGGYDSSFTIAGSTMTTIQGSLTISGGAVTVENLVIQ